MRFSFSVLTVTNGPLCSSPFETNACCDSFQSPVTLNRNEQMNKMNTFFISIRHHRTFSCNYLIQKNNPLRHYSCSIQPQTGRSYSNRSNDKSACWPSLGSISLRLVFKSHCCQDEQTKSLVRLKARNSIFS